MQVKDLQLKRAMRSVLIVLLLYVAGMTKMQAQNITFADANVKFICVTNWDTDGDGELSQAEAAVVTSLDGVFMFDDGITTFDELWLFTGLTSIGEDEFNSCINLTAISIPNTVTSIESYAFSDCSSLATITIYAFTPPTLGSYVFDNVPSTVTIKVPNGISELYQTTIGWEGFIHYEEFIYGLWPISFADADVKAICVAHWDTNGDGELSYDEAAAVTNLGTYFKSTAITLFDELEYFTGLVSIPNTAFYGCTSLASIALPSSVSALGNGSFYNCTNLATMTVYAETPPTVGTNAFKNVPTDMMVYVPCGTDDIYSDANGWSEFANIQEHRSCPIVFADANVKTLCVANWDTNGDGELSYAEAAAVTDLGTVFKSKSNITTFNELQYFTGLTSISREAFYNCNALASITIPNSVTSIGGVAFYDCSGLTSIEIPNSVTSIGGLAFGNCTGLISIFIPNSVSYIGVTQPFDGCSSLEQIIVDSGNQMYDSRENCNAIIKTSTNELITGCKNTVIPNTIVFIGDHAFDYCTGLTSIEIPNSVTSIKGSAFYHCTGLTSIELSNSLTSIGNFAFSGCTGLTSVELPNSLTSIGDNAFSSCTGLTSVEFPNSLTSIGRSAFYYCTGLTSIELSNCLTTIGYSAFSSCTGLISVEFPNSLSSIGDYAFSSCTSLTSMTVLANNPPALGGDYVFSFVNKSISLYVPCASMLAYQNTSGWNEFTNYMPITECESGEIMATANPAEGGMVTGLGFYEGGAICSLAATANTGYAFVDWTKDGEVVSNSDIYSFYVAGDATFVANFIEIPPAPVIAEYYPEPNEPNCPNVKVNWAPISSEAQIGEGTLTFGYFPFYTYFNYSIAENLYLASELEEVGFISSPMTSLSWYATYAPGYAQQGINIWMANVSDTELTTTSHTVNDMTLVYTGAMTPEIGWNEFVFNEGTFVWDGVSNVLIFCQRNNGEWNSTVKWQASNVGFNASSYNYRDSAPYDVNVANTMNNISTTRPNIIMKGSGSMTYNLYRSNCDGTGAQLIAENLSETEYIDATWWQLENDSYKYGVSVADSTNTEIFWSNCIENNYNPTAFHFITTGNWSIPSNWSTCALPGANDEVFIDAPCQLDQNATVTALTVSDGQSLTLQSGKTLTVTGNLSNTVATSLVIEDGAQLIHNVANVQATVRKHITPFSGSDDSWHLIALPLTGSSNVASVTNLLEGEYDLYGYDEATAYWRNQKHTESGFTELETTKGYLYANGEEVILGFSGTLENSSATITVPLSFTDGAHLSGFNLVGNPFPCNAYLNREYYVLTTDGTDINPEPIPATTPIPPCTAVFVKAVAVGETVVFTRVVQ